MCYTMSAQHIFIDDIYLIVGVGGFLHLLLLARVKKVRKDIDKLLEDGIMRQRIKRIGTELDTIYRVESAE
jgi:hypothetical protein